MCLLPRARRTARLLPAVLGLLLGAAGVASVPAQGTPLRDRPLNVFLDCQTWCYGEYVRLETTWAEFVRDRFVADVHLIVTRISTGSGGREYNVEVIGLLPGLERSDTLRISTEPNATEDQRRVQLLRIVHAGLLPYAMRSQSADLLSVRALDRPVGRVVAPINDPWNLWVFRVGLDGSFNKEQRREREEFEGELTARRIAADWKIGFELSSELTRTRFDLGDRTTTNVISEYRAGGVLIRSLGPRVGIGMEGSLGSATFDNLSRAVRFAPAVEFSLWPYADVQRRQLVLQFSAGLSSFDYLERTIFDQLSETRPTSSVVIGYDTRQPWGSAEATFEGASFLHDTRRYRLVLDYEASFRITTGLNFDIGGRASLVRDQLNIAARDATPEEILLELRELGTDYRYNMRVGLSYTFGSIFNSVVNPRFGSGPGSVLR